MANRLRLVYRKKENKKKQQNCYACGKPCTVKLIILAIYSAQCSTKMKQRDSVLLLYLSAATFPTLVSIQVIESRFIAVCTLSAIVYVWPLHTFSPIFFISFIWYDGRLLYHNYSYNFLVMFPLNLLNVFNSPHQIMVYCGIIIFVHSFEDLASSVSATEKRRETGRQCQMVAHSVSSLFDNNNNNKEWQQHQQQNLIDTGEKLCLWIRKWQARKVHTAQVLSQPASNSTIASYTHSHIKLQLGICCIKCTHLSTRAIIKH